MTIPEYIIIQAGGKGTRLKRHTANKPKAIVSVENLPMIFHLFRKYPNSKYVVIGDHLKEVLDRYLDTFCDVRYVTVGTDGCKGTCSGISNALELIPPDKKIMLIWSDLVLGEDFKISDTDKDLIGTSGKFECRWSYKDGTLTEEPSDKDGVAGLFVFSDKSKLDGVPYEGEFVRWLQSKNLRFERAELIGSAEYGLEEKITSPEAGKCRPFNSMRIEDGLVVKEGIDEQGKKLAVRETAWYRHVSDYDVAIPKIYIFDPLTMERIEGENVSAYSFTYDKRKEILVSIMDSLKSLHTYDLSPMDPFSMYEAYYKKTVDRLNKIRNLVPFTNDSHMTVNGKRCRNVFFHLDELRERLKQISCKHFCLIHGDCTFSNIMLRNGKEPVFIDPRGYFGFSELVGDPAYDWAKLYYSVVGDYDKFNLGKFELKIGENEISLTIETNGWKDVEGVFIENLPEEVSIEDIRLIHAIIWLSLTTYAWNDYDSVCGAFYNGLYYLEDAL